MEPTENSNQIHEDVVNDEEVGPPKEVVALIEKIEALIKSENISLLKDLKGYPEFLHIPEVKAFGENLFLEQRHSDKLKETRDLFHLTSDFLEQTAIDRVSSGNFNWDAITETHQLSLEFIGSERFQKIVQGKIVSDLIDSNRNFYRLDAKMKIFNIDPKIFKNEEYKSKGIEIIKSWIYKQGGSVESFIENKNIYGYSEKPSVEDFKNLGELFGIEDFQKSQEAHDLALTNISFSDTHYYNGRFESDDKMNAYRELFSITDDEFINAVVERVTKYAESLSSFKFEIGPNKYYFDSFSKKVSFLSDFINKYPVPVEVLENVSKTILTHAVEVLDEKIFTNTVRSESVGSYDTSYSGFTQYKELIKLINKSFLSPYAKLPEFQEHAEKLVKYKILEIFKKIDSGYEDKVIKDVREVNHAFGLEKIKIQDETEWIEGIECVRRDSSYNADIIEWFIKKMEEIATISTELKSEFVLNAVAHSLYKLLEDFDKSAKDRWNNPFESLEKKCKNIKDLFLKYDIDEEIFFDRVDGVARSIDTTHDTGQKVLEIIRKQIGFSFELSDELFYLELNKIIDSWQPPQTRLTLAERNANGNEYDDYDDHYDYEEDDIVSSANESLKKYGLHQVALTQAITEIYKDLINQGEQIKAEKLAQKFGIVPETIGLFDREEVKKIKIEKLKSLYLDSGDFVNAIVFIENNPDIQDAAKILDYQQVWIEIGEAIEKKHSEYAFKLLKYLALPGYGPEDLISYHPKHYWFFDKLKKQNLKLASKFLESFDSLFTIWPYIKQLDKSLELISEKPFLGDALAANDKFGIKFLLKYPTLDKLSKANIDTLYENKSSILENHNDIDVDSFDFRIAMQDKLQSYRRNPDIIDSLRKSGIDVERWLNYDNESYFELGNNEDVSFSEMVSTPIERIYENMSQYAEVTKEVLTEYKAEFLAFEVPLKDIEELRENIRGLRAQLEGEKHGGDERKIEGIKKAIINMESQVENPKTTPLWNKIINALSLVNILNKDVFKAYTILIESETGIKEKESDTSIPATLKRKEVLRLKHKIEKSKKDIEEKVKLLLPRLIKFDDDFVNMISLAIGKERAEGLNQERKGVINELIDHFTVDGDTLNKLFSQKESNNLYGRPMKISVWNRNPDIDLYLGNYTNCCIRIDSDHMGEESTIADYLTDLGMQIVNIYDEKENIPIASAWCFIGHDDDDKVSLVIDNIEANSDYSTKYKTQLEQKLSDYISKYTNSISTVSPINFVQGKKDNKLFISKMDSDYFKVGGYNRASGYYLQGEGRGH